MEKKKIKRKKREMVDGVEVVDESKMYFNQGTQDAIVTFQTLTNKRKREEIYINEILPAFKKLVENLINIHKFVGLHDSYDDLKNDCINFLFETIGKFDASRGTNAFSYFNVVAKNWLIIKTKQKSTHLKKSISMDDNESLSNDDLECIESHGSLQSQDIIFDSMAAPFEMLELLHRIRGELRTESELACINSVITIFENIDDIDFLNKSAILLYMRELSGLTPKQLTNSLQNIKKKYRSIKIEEKNNEY